jgi:hypothetical protein
MAKQQLQEAKTTTYHEAEKVLNMMYSSGVERHYKATRPVDRRLPNAVKALGLKRDDEISGVTAATQYTGATRWETYRNDDVAVLVVLRNDHLYISGYVHNTKGRDKLAAALEQDGLYDSKMKKREEKIEKREATLGDKELKIGSKVVFSGDLYMVVEINKSGRIMIRNRKGRKTTVSPTSVKPYDPSKGDKQFETPMDRRKKKFADEIAAKGIKAGGEVEVKLNDWEAKAYGKPTIIGIYTGVNDVRTHSQYLRLDVPNSAGTSRTSMIATLDQVKKA